MSSLQDTVLRVVSASLATATVALWYINSKNKTQGKSDDASSGVAFKLKDRTKVAKRGPFKVDVEAGKTYYWCSCGRSKNQPYCDGSHDKEKTGLKPKEFKPDKSETVWLCGCKQTNNPPFCDGTHKNIPA